MSVVDKMGLFNGFFYWLPTNYLSIKIRMPRKTHRKNQDFALRPLFLGIFARYWLFDAFTTRIRPVVLVAIWCIFSMYFLPIFARLEKYIEFLAIHRITSLKISVFGQRLFHVFFLYSGYFFLRVDNVINKNNIDDGMEWKSRRYISQDTMIQ